VLVILTYVFSMNMINIQLCINTDINQVSSVVIGNKKMMSSLQEQIKNQLEKRHMKVVELEKLSGLSTSVIRNILSGRSNNPTLETLLAITKVLGCSLSDLIMDHDKSIYKGLSKSPLYDNSNQLNWVAQLLIDVISYIEILFQKENYNPSFDVGIYLAKEIYHYSIEKNDYKLDKGFAEWIVNKKIKEDKMINSQR
jgi:transcriptional regulator with XRE-family HTH domain